MRGRATSSIAKPHCGKQRLHRDVAEFDFRYNNRLKLGALDLNGWLVEQGRGIAYRKYSTPYVAQETAAKAAKRGLWAGTFTPPWDWRKGERTGSEGQIGGMSKAPGGCAIKGNINRKGERIYHMSGSTWYGRTAIDLSAGERMFCSEADAVAAGWRPVKD